MIQMIGDHLWQSTLFAAAAALLALALRTSLAHVRYWVWLAASLKFLAPFIALVALGRQFGWRSIAAAADAGAPPVTTLISAVGRPLSAPGAIVEASLPATVGVIAFLPALLAAAWIAGTLVVLAVWVVRLRRVAAIVRDASPLNDARVLNALQRHALTVRAVSCDASLEPGVFGLVRPVLIWPPGIGDRLSDDQIDAIVAHEVCHVERRDNLTAAVHMAVQAMFWFHPLVWWIGARLVDERERACDEAVLRRGSEPQVYAESLLRTCEFSVEAPAVCIGVTGSDLKKRIEAIMRPRHAKSLTRWRRALLAAALTAAIGGPFTIGLLTPAAVAQTASPLAQSEPLPSFEVASVKPNKSPGPNPTRIGLPGNRRFNVDNMALRGLIQFAYDVQPFQLTGGPGWIDSERFDVTATMAEVSGPPAIRLMLQSLLAERFQLAVHEETREMDIYQLVLARSDGRLGEKLRQAGPDCTPLTIPAGMPSPPPPPPSPAQSGAPAAGGRGLGPAGGCPMIFGPGFMSARRTTMGQLARSLGPRVRRLIVDKTGLTGFYDADLEFTPDVLPQQLPGGPQFPEPSGDAPSIYTALPEQLGLKLESARGPVDMVVIDRVEPLIPD